MGKKYRCPNCKAVIMKSSMEQTMDQAKGVIFTSDPGKKKCPACGKLIAEADIISGKYDVKWWQSGEKTVLVETITTCSNCGSKFRWDKSFWTEGGMPDCPACGFNNQTGRKGKGEGPIERGYRKMARDLAQQHGPLRFVEYLSHFPDFEINFVFDKHTVYSGRRRGEYDIHFLSLGYVGEGPRYARVFLDELGFSMTSEEIAAIRPGVVIKLDGGKVVVQYKPTES